MVEERYPLGVPRAHDWEACESCISSRGASAAVRSSSPWSSRGARLVRHTNEVLALGLGFDGSEDVDLPPLTRRSDGGFRALWLGARALRRHLALEPVDIVIAHGGRAVEAAVLARRRHRPVIVWQRILGFPPHMWRPIRRLRWRAIVHRIDAAVALTPDLGDELGRLGFKGPVWAIPNFRDPEPFVAVDRTGSERPTRRARHPG